MAAELRLASGAFDGLADQDAQTDARAPWRKLQESLL